MSTPLRLSKPSVKSDRSNAPDHQARELYRDLQLVIEYLPIDDLKVYDRNPRIHPKRQIEQIAESMRAFGVVSPLAIDGSGTLIAGHGRLAAAKRLGYTTLPVIRIDHLDEAQLRALAIADNQLAALAGWDKELLALEFKYLLELDLEVDLSFDLAITGFDAAEIDRLVEDTSDQGDNGADHVPEPDLKEPPVAFLGDLWVLGEHRILCGDAREAGSYTALLGDERAAMSISDAPYNISIAGMVSKSGKHAEFCMGVGELTKPAFTSFLTSFLTHSRVFSQPGAIHFTFMDWRHLGEMLAAGQGAGLELKNLCIWNKSSAGMGGGGYRSQHELVFMWKDPGAPHVNNVQLGKFGRNRTNVWDFPGAAGLRKELELHPTPKPVSLIAEAIRDVSNRNDIVFDCFSGSGTTIIAAAKTGRRARVIELDPHYVDVAIARWLAWSGQTALLAETGLSFAAMREQRADTANRLVGSAGPQDMAGLAAEPSPSSLPQVRVRRRTPVAAQA